MPRKRTVCIFTGSRAEYGLLKPLMEEIKKDPEIRLQILVSGMHLSPEFGMTYKSIEQDGFRIDEKIEILMSADTSTGICKSVGMGMISFSDAFLRLLPDMVVILGDRFESFSAAASAMICRIPIVHIHGGELTQGAMDDSIRHAITKMSHIHFTSTREYRRRVIQMGECPDLVFNVGALGVDSISRMNLLSKREFEEKAGFRVPEKSFMVTFHPVTLDPQKTKESIANIFHALDYFPDYFVIFTKANADEAGRMINHMIEDYVEKRELSIAVTSLGQLLYLSALNFVDAVIGNSSSGIIEVPSFRIPTINVGDRQKGRICAKSVLNCPPETDAIVAALNHGLSKAFKQDLADTRNPYEKTGTTQAIQNILKTVKLDDIIKKEFNDGDGL